MNVFLGQISLGNDNRLHSLVHGPCPNRLYFHVAMFPHDTRNRSGYCCSS